MRAYSSARRIRPAFITGRPSSVTATMPAAFSSPISASASPLSPLEIAPTGKTRATAACARAREDELGDRAVVVQRVGVGHASRRW